MKKAIGVLLLLGGIFAATYNWKKNGYIATIKKNPYGLITNKNLLNNMTEDELLKMSLISKKMETDTATQDEIMIYAGFIKKYNL